MKSNGKASGPIAHIGRQHLRMPYVEPGLAVGLFGGSFNPPHEGHALVCEIAMRRLQLDQIWWIVTPGNPLKDTRVLKPLADRIRLSEEIATDPRIKVTAFEARHKVRYSADTIAIAQKRNAGVDFVWLMGADNLKEFHRWQHWRRIVQSIPIAVIDRPGSTLSYLSSQMAISFDDCRLDEEDAPLLPRMRPPAWTFIHGPRSSLSSTALRAAAKAAL